MMKLAAFAAALLAASTFGLAPVSAADLDKIILSSTGTSALSWPIFGAQAKGYFRDAGLQLDFIHNASSSAGMQQLAAGSVNMSSNGLVDPIRAIAQGAPITLVRLEMIPAPYQVFAKSSIHSFADLKGKTVVIGGRKDITRIYFERMAKPEGLAPGSYDMIFAGTASARTSALFSGSVDAAVLNPPYNFKAQAAGYRLLPAPANFSQGVPFSGYSVNVPWAKGHKKLVAKFMRAYARGVSWFYDPNNKSEAIDVLRKQLSINPQDAEKTYDFYIAIKAYDPVGAITQANLGPLLKILKTQGDIHGSTDVSRFYTPDLSADR